MLYTENQMNDLSKARLADYEAAADAERTSRSTIAPITLGDRIGDLLLRWGRGLRERSGAVCVQIALEPADGPSHDHAA